MPKWSRPFHPLDFTVIDFMQVNDCEGGRKEGATQTMHSKGRTWGVGRTTGAGVGAQQGWGRVGRGEADYKDGADDRGWGGQWGGGAHNGGLGRSREE